MINQTCTLCIDNWIRFYIIQIGATNTLKYMKAFAVSLNTWKLYIFSPTIAYKLYFCLYSVTPESSRMIEMIKEKQINNGNIKKRNRILLAGSGNFYSFTLKFAHKKVFCTVFKGYLCYKTITSQNILSEAQVKNFFIS